MIKEKWAGIPGFEGFYQVSDKGRIKSLKRTVDRSGHTMIIPERIMVQVLNNKGRLRVRLYKGGVGCNKSVSRLVAIQFVKNPYNKPEVNHLDGNKLNNKAANLAWATEEENYNHAQKNGLMARGDRQAVAKLTNKIVLDIFKSKMKATELSNKYKVTVSNVYAIKKGFSWKWLTMGTT